MNLISAVCIVATCVSLLLAGLVLRLNPRAPLNLVISLACVAYAVWALGASFAVTAQDASGFWFSLRMAFAGNILLQPIGTVALALLTGIRGWRLWLFLLPMSLASTLDLYLATTGIWTISGYHTSAWGNVIEPNPDVLGLNVATANQLVYLVIGLGMFGLAGWQSSSRRYRTILIQIILVTVVVRALDQFCNLVLWQTWGLPNVSVLAYLLYPLYYFVLINRHDHLVDVSRQAPSPVLATLLKTHPDLVAFVDGSGSLLHVSDRLSVILGEPEQALRGRPLNEVLGGWPQLIELWPQLQQDHQPRLDLPGTLGDEKFFLSLEPSPDRYRDLGGVMVRLRGADTFTEAFVRFGISPREKEIALLLLEGLSNQQIGETLFISTGTVKNHLQNLFRKTATSNRVELLRALQRPVSDQPPLGPVTV